MAVKTFVANKAANRARQSGQPVQSNGGDQHVVVGYAGVFNYWAYVRFTLDWAGVKRITKAEIVGVRKAAHLTRDATGTIRAVRLKASFDDLPSAASEAYHTGSFDVPAKDTEASAYKAVTVAVDQEFRLDISSIVGAWAPKTVKQRTGKAGLAKTNHGLILERGTSKGAVFASDLFSDAGERIKIELTYEASGVPGTVTLDGPVSPITQVEGEFFEGTYVPGSLGDTISRVAIQLYPNAATVSDAGTEAKWKYDKPGSASDRETGAFSVPVPVSLRSGTTYKWRARVQNQKGVWTPWTATTVLSVVTEAPTLSEIVPSGTFDTLNQHDFGAHYHDDNANMMASYRVQVRTETLPSDPDWGTTEFLWDTGDVAATLLERFPTTSGTGREQRTPVTGAIVLDPGSGGKGGVIRVPYGGNALEPGTYSFRIHATDNLGAVSDWEYGEFELTVGFDPDPGENANPLSGYARRKVRTRVLIKAMSDHTQRVYVKKSSGGTFRLTLDGQQTATIAWDVSAATLKSKIEALSNVTTVTVTLNGTPGTSAFYTIVFGNPATPPGVLEVSANSLTGSGHAVYAYSTRAPGVTVAYIEDPANLGAGEYYNSPGEAYFTVPAIHPQVSVIEPWQVHYAIEVFRGEGWKEIAAGLIIDFDATDNDVVFHGIDYLGLLGLEMDERFNTGTSGSVTAEAPAGIWPAAEGGSKYTSKTIKVIITDQLNWAIYSPNSKVGFLSLGAIATMDEVVTIFSTFKQRLPFIAGLIDSHKAGTGKRTRLRVRKTITGSYEFRLDDNPGVDRDNIRFEYGGLVQGFRVIPFGDYGTRVNAIGRGLNTVKVEYYIASTPAPAGELSDFFERAYGRTSKVNLWQDISDKNDLIRRAKQMAKALGKLGKRVALGLRVDALGPKDGWDIADSLRVDVVRGVVDTNRYGSGYWTCWGWAFRVFPDGHSDLTLSLLPREDDEAPDLDLIEGSPINPGDNWTIGYAPPVVGTTTGVLFFDASTGITYELQDDGSWAILDSPDVPTAPTGLAITSRATLNPDGTTVANVRVSLVPATDDAVRATKIALTSQSALGVPVWDENQLIVEVPLGQTEVAIENVQADTEYFAKAWSEDVFGVQSAETAVESATTEVDTTAPSVPTGLTGYGGILGIIGVWSPVTATDLAYYEVRRSPDDGSGLAPSGVWTTAQTKGSILTVYALAAGRYWLEVRAVDLTGNASAWSAAVSADSRTAVTADLTDNLITAAKIVADAVTTVKIADDAVNAAKIAASAVGTTELDALAVTGAKIAAGAVTAAKITAGTITANEIAALTILAANIAAGAITTTKIAAGAVTANEIAALTITAAQIAAGTIVAAKIAAGTITSNEIAALTIVAANIAAGTITAAKIAAGTITATEIAADTILAGNIAAGAVSTSELAVGAVLTGGVSNVGATVVISSTGIAITNGALSFSDAWGTEAINGYGFGPAWMRFIRQGLFNSDFGSGSTSDIAATEVSGAATIADYKASITSGLPGWIVAASGGSVALIADTTASNSLALQFLQNGASQTARVYQDTPIEPRGQYAARINWRAIMTGAADFSLNYYWSFRDKNHALIGSRTGGGLAYDTVFTAPQATYLNLGDALGSGEAPANAVYVRFEIEVVHGAYTAGTKFADVRVNDCQVLQRSVPTMNVYTSNGTWTKPKDLDYVIVETVGGGGGGGGSKTTGVGEGSAGGGGGGGGYTRTIIPASQLAADATAAITVGAAANGGTGGGTGGAGTAGNLSKFVGTTYGTIQSNGGGAGAGSANTAANQNAQGGAGGTGSAGTISVTGSDGGTSAIIGGVRTYSGTGGASGGGMGGSTRQVSGVGGAGNQYGGGGAGGTVGASTTGVAGGAGAAGVVIVTEYYKR